MQIWMSLILVVQILSALTMIVLVLIQHGKGADMGASFGSGSSGSLFGASGSANFLSRSTGACATVFFLCTLGLTYLGNSQSSRATTGGSVLDRPALAASGPATGVIPGAAPAASGAVTAPAGVPAPAAVPAPATVPVAGAASAAPATAPK